MQKSVQLQAMCTYKARRPCGPGCGWDDVKSQHEYLKCVGKGHLEGVWTTRWFTEGEDIPPPNLPAEWNSSWQRRGQSTLYFISISVAVFFSAREQCEIERPHASRRCDDPRGGRVSGRRSCCCPRKEPRGAGTYRGEVDVIPDWMVPGIPDIQEDHGKLEQAMEARQTLEGPGRAKALLGSDDTEADGAMGPFALTPAWEMCSGSGIRLGDDDGTCHIGTDLDALTRIGRHRRRMRPGSATSGG